MRPNRKKPVYSETPQSERELDDKLSELVVPRCAPDVERSVLGALIYNWRAVWPFVDGRVTRDDFANSRHARIFESIAAMIGRQIGLDIGTLAAEMGPAIDAVGGVQYLHELTDYGVTQAHIEDWVRVLTETTACRRVQDVAVRSLLAVQTRPFDEMVVIASEMEAALNGGGGAPEVVPVRDVLVEMWERIEESAKMGGRIGRTTGLLGLDALLGGLSAGQLVLIGARPAMGKTSALIKMVDALAREAHARGEKGIVLVFSLEMPRVEITQRHACQIARVSEETIRHSALNDDDITRLTAASNELAVLPIEVADKVLTLGGIRAACHRAKMKYGKVIAVAVDYLQLVEVPEMAGYASREQEISKVSRGFKQLAKELECPLLTLSQLNRKCEERGNKRPMLSDLRESGAIEQDCDVVMFLYRDEVYDKDSQDRGIAEFIVAKQRGGRTDTVRARFEGEFTKFSDLTVSD